MNELEKSYEFTRAQIAELESPNAIIADLLAEYERLEAENKILRNQFEEAEKQTPIGEIIRTETSHGCDRTAISWFKYPYAKYGAKLYLSPVVNPIAEKYDWLQKQHLEVIAENARMSAKLAELESQKPSAYQIQGGKYNERLLHLYEYELNVHPELERWKVCCAPLYLGPKITPEVKKLTDEIQSLKDKIHEQNNKAQVAVSNLNAEISSLKAELEAARKGVERRRRNSVNAWSN